MIYIVACCLQTAFFPADWLSRYTLNYRIFSHKKLKELRQVGLPRQHLDSHIYIILKGMLLNYWLPRLTRAISNARHVFQRSDAKVNQVNSQRQGLEILVFTTKRCFLAKKTRQASALIQT